MYIADKMMLYEATTGRGKRDTEQNDSTIAVVTNRVLTSRWKIHT